MLQASMNMAGLKLVDALPCLAMRAHDAAHGAAVHCVLAKDCLRNHSEGAAAQLTPCVVRSALVC
jgi:hypothetical protein